jgi:DNA-binding MarR family transcriptional regulator
MTDLLSATVKPHSGQAEEARPTGSRRAADEPALVDLVELLFFAYRDFTGDADEILAEFGYGRAHHRVLHFVGRNPGLRVADLLQILKITKQSLARVLRQLVTDGFVEQRLGPSDRRERRLYATPEGMRLARRLLEPQIARMRAATAASGKSSDRDLVKTFLFAMIEASDRARVTSILSGSGEGSAAGNREDRG